tara:strand:- start:316 stop:1656 length:1341 start_codon:yes stop_codon:yes gene_type:complete
MINGAPYNVFDYMTPAEINAVVNNDYSAVTTNQIYAAILSAEAAVPNGGKLYWPNGFYNIGSNIWTLASKIIRHFSDASYLTGEPFGSGGPYITGTGFSTIRTEVSSGAGASRGTEFSGFKVNNDNVDGACIYIRNGGIRLNRVVAQCSGANGEGILVTQMYAMSWDQVFCAGSNSAIRLYSDGNPGSDSIISNTFTQLAAFGSNVPGANGLYIDGATQSLVRNNTFINFDTEQTTTGIYIAKGRDNAFINANIESTTTGIFETTNSNTTWITPFLSFGLPSTISLSSENIPAGFGASTGARQFANAVNGVPFKINPIPSSDENTLDYYFEFAPVAANSSGAIVASNTYKCTRIGSVITLCVNGISGTASAATSFRLGQTLPASLYPTNTVFMPIVVLDNSVNVMGAIRINTSGNIDIYRDITQTTNFTAAALAGIPALISVSWVI